MKKILIIGASSGIGIVYVTRPWRLIVWLLRILPIEIYDRI